MSYCVYTAFGEYVCDNTFIEHFINNKSNQYINNKLNQLISTNKATPINTPITIQSTYNSLLNS